MPKVTEDCINLIKKFEGCVLHPYKDSVGINTIGYGHKILPGERFTTITQNFADELLMNDIKKHEKDLIKLIKVPVNDNEYGALVDFTFNLGAHRLEKSTLLTELNDGDYIEAAYNFMKWVYAGNPPQKLPGLMLRRAADLTLFLKPTKGERHAIS